MYFELIGDIADVEVIAAGSSIRRLALLQTRYGQGRWRKLKGTAWVRVAGGKIVWAEVHWFEAHGLGRKGLKIKRVLSEG
jgi:hypothetical protein